MFNILPSALSIVKILCPEVPLTLTIHPQTQEAHADPAPTDPPRIISTTGIIQTTTPEQTDIIASTINSPRLFRIYIPSISFDIISHIQNNTSTITTDFIYSTTPVHARVYGFKDYRYNGWVALLASQASPRIHNPHTIHPDIIL